MVQVKFKKELKKRERRRHDGANQHAAKYSLFTLLMNGVVEIYDKTGGRLLGHYYPDTGRLRLSNQTDYIEAGGAGRAYRIVREAFPATGLRPAGSEI